MSPINPDSPRGTHAAGEPPRGMSRIDYEQLVRDLRERVGVVSLDSLPAGYAATLRDQERTFRASAMGPGLDYAGDYGEAEQAIINGIIVDVVVQALAARKAGG